jgi:uncharacterized protein YndB with AHSA1/START domain
MCCFITNRIGNDIIELRLTKIPIAKAELLIRKPVAEVYDAFVNPAHTRKFWFSKSTGRFEVGKRIRWEWEMYRISTSVDVKILDPGKRIVLDWGVDENPTTVEWIFTPRANDTTLVSIINSGFSGDGDKVVEEAMSSAAGFELVLAGLKAYLEHGIELNLIADTFPDRIVGHPTVTHIFTGDSL